MKKYFIHNPVFRLAGPPIYGILIYLLILLINNNIKSLNELFNTQEVYVCIALSYISMESCRVFVLLTKRIQKQQDSIRNVIIQILFTTLLSVSLVIGSLSLYFKFFIGFDVSITELRIFAMLFTAGALLYNTLYLSNYFLHKENTLKLNAEQQQREVLELEMTEFRNDINPDLLYESLESLIAIMYRDVEQAEEYIDCLSSTYRYVLGNRHQELSPLHEEIQAARNIIRLINEKYHGQILLHISMNDVYGGQMLVPGSLPLVIENIVRSTIVSRYEPLTIQCYIEDDYFTIQSKLNDRLLVHAATDHAFRKLQRSYSLFSDRPLIKIKAYQDNYIKLPLIAVTEELV